MDKTDGIKKETSELLTKAVRGQPVVADAGAARGVQPIIADAFDRGLKRRSKVLATFIGTEAVDKLEEKHAIANLERLDVTTLEEAFSKREIDFELAIVGHRNPRKKSKYLLREWSESDYVWEGYEFVKHIKLSNQILSL
jgi:hypothetical protein